MKRKLLRSEAFVRAAKKQFKKNQKIGAALQRCLKQLEEDAFDHTLKTHKLKGLLNGSWAASAGYDLRVIFKFVSHQNEECVLLETIGTHDEVY